MHIKDLSLLIAYLDKGNTAEYLFFWSHQPKDPKIIDKSCLSQWYPASFTIDSITYQTAEHFMMAEKARLFHDEKMVEKIIPAPTAREAKMLGRQINNFDPVTWQAHRFEIVVTGNRAKFLQHSQLKSFLLKTECKILVEASPIDPLWGIGLSQENPEAHNPRTWPGLNLLGFALMTVRENL